MAMRSLGTLDCCCLEPGFLLFWKELCTDGGSYSGYRLKFPRQYPDFGHMCLGKIYVHWLAGGLELLGGSLDK